ncbi:molybdopterin-binding/glycosyltransferase family 2 protein [Azospirillum sp. TSO22-1]|uniref:NTP transferase domain-containing protein n=1 Tax=Azospirillum sp. TSO22-1 TaxID=716789 RepID=UPI000D61995D|nr:molybdopterin-binding/glycosyltransferase family 2 protein [Azospirillum sp. TSO22-1]PWC55550.1 4-diphosphocytidyl-2C-methyl-D-erythritol kinase [Azospirillum sp. TSO22-1]
MYFGPVPVAEAAGTILVHSVRKSCLILKKGRVLSAEDVAALEAAGFATVTVARPDASDVGEDEAATRVAAALRGGNLSVAAAFTGRVNLFAEAAGLVVLDRARLEAVNLADESVTIATLPAFAQVVPGQMVATVKIIPFAAPRAAVERGEAALAEGGAALRVAPYRPMRAGLLQTELAGTKGPMLDKTVAVTRERLESLGGTLMHEARCPHDEAALAALIEAARPLGLDLLLIAGASAITDRRDVLPGAIERAGGVVEHFGMPVDPGNLLLLANLDGIPVLGLPGCARSPKLNGFDWVLQRLAAGVPVSREDVMRMGVGGLLAEIPSRGLPRAGVPEAPRAPRIAAVVLAAGRSSRMGGPNKLLADVHGTPLLARTVDAVLASAARPVVVVTGHQADAVRAALGGRPVTVVHNPDFAEGLSTSLRVGLAALPADVDGVLVCLGDMPAVASGVLDRLIAAYNPTEGRAICVPVAHGRRGNPVLWDRRFFADMARVSGDTGARHLIGENAEQVCEIQVEGDGVLADVDTPDGLARLMESSRSAGPTPKTGA